MFFGTSRLRIHMTGICGVGMSALAGMLQSQGHCVQGSDTDIYPPMSTLLAQLNIPVIDGYRTDTIEKINPDVAIIGNAISRGNPEVEAVLNKRIPYFSMAQALYYFFLHDKAVIGVAGTHGKTTTASLLAHILEMADMKPSFFIGGIPVNYGVNYKVGTGSHFVIEADEYDSAFFEKIPKFIVYRPTHCIMTSLEFDHADIYADINEITLWFNRLRAIIPSNGHIVYNKHYQHLCTMNSTPLSITTSYGNAQADYSYRYERGVLTISGNGTSLSAKPAIFGDYNYQNITAAAAMALTLGISMEAIVCAIDTFKGVKRRQEILYSSDHLTIIEDFAHHPTAIKNVLCDVLERYPDSTVIALYEPRSATSRRNVFQNELPSAFYGAHYVFMKRPYRLDKVPLQERIDIDRVINDMRGQSINAVVLDSAQEMAQIAFETVNSNKHTVMLVMSNGGFDGIYELLVSRARNTTRQENR